MIIAIEGWEFFVTPISLLGVHPITKKYFAYFMTLQVVILGALYKRRNVKPFIVFMGLSALSLLSIYDMYYFSSIHNFFAFMFFIIQPLIFFLEYKKSKDSYALTKVAVLLFLILLTWIGVLPLPLFEYLSYILLILFL
jgi:hypothetical protein